MSITPLFLVVFPLSIIFKMYLIVILLNCTDLSKLGSTDNYSR